MCAQLLGMVFPQKRESNLNDNNGSGKQVLNKTVVAAIMVIRCANEPQLPSYCLAVLYLTLPRARQAPPQDQKESNSSISVFPGSYAFDRFCFGFKKDADMLICFGGAVEGRIQRTRKKPKSNRPSFAAVFPTKQ